MILRSSIYFAILSGVCFKKYIEKLENGQRSEMLIVVKMLSRFRYFKLFEAKPEVSSSECLSIFEKTKC